MTPTPRKEAVEVLRVPFSKVAGASSFGREISQTTEPEQDAPATPGFKGA